MPKPNPNRLVHCRGTGSGPHGYFNELDMVPATTVYGDPTKRGWFCIDCSRRIMKNLGRLAWLDTEKTLDLGPAAATGHVAMVHCSRIACRKLIYPDEWVTGGQIRNLVPYDEADSLKYCQDCARLLGWLSTADIARIDALFTNAGLLKRSPNPKPLKVSPDHPTLDLQ